jgi:hypothetical protein
MPRFTRRTFTSTALISSFALPLPGQQRPPLPPDFPRDQAERAAYRRTPFDSIVGCRFVAVEAGSLLCSDGGQPRSIRIAPGCIVWKGSEARDFAAVRSGDTLDIRIRRDSGAADYVWVNIAKAEGEIRAIRQGGFDITPFSTTDRLGLLEGQNIAVKVSGKTELPNGFRLQPALVGRAVMIIGLRLEDGSIEASRITLGN